jgi:diketogulonate reductase-like aldo/keto reductase
LYKQKKIRAIGVSNFEIKHLKNILKHCTIKPMVNQIEMHPGVNNKKLLKFCKKNNIVVEAYAPLAQGRIKDDPIVNTIAKEMNKTAAQVSLR